MLSVKETVVESFYKIGHREVQLQKEILEVPYTAEDILKLTGTVGDGILYVPGGLLPQEIAALQTKFPVIGRESEFGKKKAAPKPEAAP